MITQKQSPEFLSLAACQPRTRLSAKRRVILEKVLEKLFIRDIPIILLLHIFCNTSFFVLAF